jgi:hypothetical protein
MRDYSLSIGHDDPRRAACLLAQACSNKLSEKLQPENQR